MEGHSCKSSTTGHVLSFKPHFAGPAHPSCQGCAAEPVSRHQAHQDMLAHVQVQHISAVWLARHGMQNSDSAPVCQALEGGGSSRNCGGYSWPGWQRSEGSQRAGRAALGLKGTSLHPAVTSLLVFLCSHLLLNCDLAQHSVGVMMCCSSPAHYCMTCLSNKLNLHCTGSLRSGHFCSKTDSRIGAKLQIIRSLVPKDQYEPPVGEYIAAAHQRMKEKQGKQRFPFPLH